MNMKNIILIFVLFVYAFNLSAQTNSEKINNNVVKNIVLINKMPWEVLMSKNGDILAKLKDIPEYLKGYEKSTPLNEIKPTPIKEKTVIASSEVKTEVYKTYKETPSNIKKANHEESKYDSERLEVGFSLGSALLRDKQISFLNGIADRLNSDPNLTFKLFSFNREPDYRYYILSRRRVEAVLGYLKVKGVNINDQIIVKSTVKGKNNKIVFGVSR